MSLESTRQAATRRHLLAAAGEVFAAAGYQAATVRQICRRAKANVAAVNYHFGGKEGLYRAVLQDSFQSSLQKYPADFGLPPKARPEQRLRAFVHSFLLRIFAEGPDSRHGRLMAREMIEPTGALDDMVEHAIRPLAGVLTAIVRDLLGPGAGEEAQRLCAMSIVSQVLFYNHCRPVVIRMFPEMKFDAPALEQLAGHITRFSLAAVKSLSRTKLT